GPSAGRGSVGLEGAVPAVPRAARGGRGRQEGRGVRGVGGAGDRGSAAERTVVVSGGARGAGAVRVGERDLRRVERVVERMVRADVAPMLVDRAVELVWQVVPGGHEELTAEAETQRDGRQHRDVAERPGSADDATEIGAGSEREERRGSRGVPQVDVEVRARLLVAAVAYLKRDSRQVACVRSALGGGHRDDIVAAPGDAHLCLRVEGILPKRAEKWRRVSNG